MSRRSETIGETALREAACSSELALRLSERGLVILGVLAPTAEDGVPPMRDGLAARAVTLVGNAGPGMWRAFQGERRCEPHPLDAWTRRTLDPIATDFGLEAVYPFSGPPYLPFHAWGLRARAFFPTPMTPAIHPRYGTWFGLRGALLSARANPAAVRVEAAAGPCDNCVGKPCLAACVCGALSPTGYDAACCLDRLESMEGAACLKNGCKARHACPIGQDYAYGQDQAEFHQRAFIQNFGPLIRAG
ncbi:MAG: ferredoxin [Rhodospirillaceae bacterium]